MSVAPSSMHPTVVALGQAREAVALAGSRDPIFLSPAEHAAALSELVALTAQVAEFQARVTLAAEPSGVQDDAGVHDVTGWIAGALRTGQSQARAGLRFAERLERWGTVAEEMQAGTVNIAQADVITRALDALPSDLDPLLRFQAELHLVALAADHGPKELRILGRRVLDVIAPEIAEAREARALEDEERTALEKTRLSLRFPGDGTFILRAVGPELSGIRLANYLHAIANPRRHHDQGDPSQDSGDDVDEVARKLPDGRKLGQAFCELMERIDPKSLPDHGSTSTELIVTMTLDDLRADLATATTLGPDGAHLISASEARRLACNAGLIPAILGTQSEVLDLGRSARLASRAQKKALMAMYPTCRGEHCDTPAAWCKVHHLDEWANGGTTDLKNLTLFCSREHHLIHHRDYQHQILPHGKVRFTRRC